MAWKSCVYMAVIVIMGVVKKQEYFAYRIMVKEREEHNRWIKSNPRGNIKDNDNTGICEQHWSDGYETVAVNGKVRPEDPPFVFPGVKPSQIPTPQPSLRPSKRLLPSKCITR